MNILFFYNELASYTVASIKQLSIQHADIHIVHNSSNHKPPSNFPNNLREYKRGNYTNEELKILTKKINPDIILCAGWKDNGVLNTIKKYYRKIPTVLLFDNYWLGNYKQKIASIISPFWLKTIFSDCWVPGENQKEFAKKLRFKDYQIHLNLYSADTILFSEARKKGIFPKRFLFLGRYVKHKGIFDLWKAFIEIQNEKPNEWELWCVGTGKEYINKIDHPKIKHFGFIEPEFLREYMLETSVLVLPSHFEPWGVCVHEAVSAGFPLILSDKVGAKEVFLTKNNGYTFESGNISALKNSMKKIIEMNENDLISMSNKSIELSLKITPNSWGDTIIKILSKND